MLACIAGITGSRWRYCQFRPFARKGTAPTFAGTLMYRTTSDVLIGQHSAPLTS